MDTLNENLDQLDLKCTESDNEISSGSENSEEEESSSDDGTLLLKILEILRINSYNIYYYILN